MNRRILRLVGVLLILGWTVPATSGEALAPEQLGLSKTAVTDNPAPPAPDYIAAAPGAGQAIPVTMPGAPPQIPHSVDGLVPITPSNNACLGCHAGKAQTAGGPTPMPESHYRDLREAPETTLKRVDGSRYLCTTCHAPQTDAKPLVKNTFVSAQ